jgi:hypothetical protein
MFTRRARPIFTTKQDENIVESTEDIESTESTIDSDDLTDPSESSEESPTPRPPNPISITMSDDEFWKEISLLGWVEVSDGPRNTSAKIKKLQSNPKIKSFKEKLRKYMDEVKEAVLTVDGLVETVDDEFTSHVVGKGKSFFYNVLADPIFAMYLFSGETEDLWKNFA